MDDTAEVKDLGEALLNLELSEAGNPTHDETMSLRHAVIEASVALRRKEPGASREDELVWQRIPWSDTERLPEPGLEITSSGMQDGRWSFHTDIVVRVRPDPEPGWVRVKLRSLE